jgi:outer membrane lipoprotein-sorting protein
VIALACVLAAECGTTRVRPELPATLPSAQQLLDVLATRRLAVESLRGFAQIAYESADENVGSRHAVLARRPDKLRLEVLSPFGVMALIASDGHDFAVYERREAKIYRGPATPESVAAYTAVPLSVADVVTVLLGSPPYRPPVGAATVTRDERHALILLTIPVAAGRQRVWFAPDTLHPVASTTGLADGRTLRVTFGDYATLGAVAFPLRIDLKAEPGTGAVHVHYATPSLNTAIADGLFTFPTLPGIEEYQIQQYPSGSAAS